MGMYLERFQGIIDQYIEAYDKADRERKPGAGIFGIGQGPGDYPCHEEMDRRVAELTEEIGAAGDAGQEETAAVVKAVLQAEKSRKWTDAARWAVLATQRHTIPLIPKLSSEDRHEINTWYKEAYPRRMRVPIQKQILKELAK